MNTKRLRQNVLSCGILLLSISMVWTSAFAAPKKRVLPPPQLVISSVFIDLDTNRLLIEGDNFDNGGAPIVTLAGEELVVNPDFTSESIEAVLPDGILDGDYLLAVSTGPAVINYDAYHLTIPRAVDPIVPKGAIIMWSGIIDGNGNPVVDGTPDTRWHICDGTSETPDLRDRFIVGSGSSYAVHDAGGAASVRLSLGELPPHQHHVVAASSPGGSHSHSYFASTSLSGYCNPLLDECGGWGRCTGVCFEVSHTSVADVHVHTIDAYTEDAGAGQPHENRPPYYALAYIMRVQ